MQENLSALHSLVSSDGAEEVPDEAVESGDIKILAGESLLNAACQSCTGDGTGRL